MHIRAEIINRRVRFFGRNLALLVFAMFLLQGIRVAHASVQGQAFAGEKAELWENFSYQETFISDLPDFELPLQEASGEESWLVEAVDSKEAGESTVSHTPHFSFTRKVLSSISFVDLSFHKTLSGRISPCGISGLYTLRRIRI